MQIDMFYQDYNSLWQNKALTPQEFKVAMDKMRVDYPFMDTVLLSKQGGVDRDRAYAYTVMGRIAPGDSKAMMEGAGLDPNIMDKFYAEKGDIGKWAEADRTKFMGAVIAIGTSLKIPEDATQREWTQARNTYKTYNDMIAVQFGRDIQAKIDAWYDLSTPEEKNAYMQQHPEVQQAMDTKAAIVANVPILAKYYDGLSNIKQYYEGQMRADVKKQLGADYYEILRLKNSALTNAQVKQFEMQYPQTRTKLYSAIKAKWDALIERELIKYGANLPDKLPSAMQDNLGKDLSVSQQAMQDALATQAGPPEVPWEQIASEVPASVQQALYNYFANDKPLTAANKYELKRTADFLGMTSDQLMQAAYKSMQVAQ
jgi:hypothetical protein